MTVQYKSKAFKAGNSAAVRLPKDVAFAPGTELTIERQGDIVTIRPVENKEAIRRKLQAMFDEIDAAWAKVGGPPPREPRDSDVFPNRPGLYGWPTPHHRRRLASDRGGADHDQYAYRRAGDRPR